MNTRTWLPLGLLLPGQHLTDTAKEWTNLVVRLHQVAGRWPGLVSFTAESSVTNTPVQTAGIIPYALETWTNGGLVPIKWAPWNPWSGKFGAASVPTLIDIPELLNPAPALATNQVARSNYHEWRQAIGDDLTTLRDAGVAVLRRPFAEMNGTWFWWGNLPRDHYHSLWRDLHGYFTQSRGLTNLLWVLEPDQSVHLVGGATSSGTPIDYYYPGDDVVDVVGPSVYNTKFKFPFSMDELFRAYPKAVGPTEVSAVVGNTNAWDLTILTTNLATTLPRAAYICAWSSFQVGSAPLVRYSPVDQTNVATLLNAPRIANRAGVDWLTYLPMNLNLRRQGPALAVDWSGGALDYSTNLVHWTAVTNGAQTWQLSGTDGLGIFRVRRER